MFTQPALLRAAAGWLLVLLAIALGVFGGAVAVVAVAALTADRMLGTAAGAVALIIVSWGLAWTAARAMSRAGWLRRWVPLVATLGTLAVGGWIGFALLFAPPPTYTRTTLSDQVRYWDLPTGSRIAYTLTPASGPARSTPAILIHGGPGAPEGGLEIAADELSDAGFNVYYYHQVGAGRSERLDDVTEYSVSRHVADLEAIRAAIGAQRVVFVGESWGGTLIAHYLASHPDRVAKAVVSSPGPIWAPAYAETNSLVPSAQRDQNAVIHDYPRFMAAHVLLQTVGAQTTYTLLPRQQMDGVFEEVVAQLDLWSGCPLDEHPSGKPVYDEQAGVGFWANAMTSSSLQHVPDPRPRLRGVGAPLLVLRSECDYRAWPATREYRDLLPNAVMLTVDDAGHVISVDRPRFYREAVRAFLLDQPLPASPYAAAAPPW